MGPSPYRDAHRKKLSVVTAANWWCFWHFTNPHHNISATVAALEEKAILFYRLIKAQAAAQLEARLRRRDNVGIVLFFLNAVILGVILVVMIPFIGTHRNISDFTPGELSRLSKIIFPLMGLFVTVFLVAILNGKYHLF
jgi:hypothetical protein